MQTKKEKVKNDIGPKILLSKNEAAALLSISYPTLHRWVMSGKIPSIQLGGRRLIPREKLIEMVNNKLALPHQRKKK